MPDNVDITAGSGTTIATDLVGTAHYQCVKLTLGADGAATVTLDDGQQNMAGSLPVVIASDQSTINIADTAAKVDDAAFTAATSYVLPAGFMLDETSTDLIDEGDAGVARITADRRQVVALGQHGALTWAATATATDDADTALKAAGGAGTYLYVTAVAFYNSSATNTFVTLKDGSTAKMVFPVPAYGGCTLAFPVPWRVTTNTALNFASGTSVTTMYASAAGYTALA